MDDMDQMDVHDVHLVNWVGAAVLPPRGRFQDPLKSPFAPPPPAPRLAVARAESTLVCPRPPK